MLLSVILLLGLSTRAATLWWDGGATTVNSASDNATTTGLAWLSGGNWDDGATSGPLTGWNYGDNAIFGGTAASQTITVTVGTPTLGNLTFGSGAQGAGTSGTAYTISGGDLTLASGSIITNNTATTISTVLSGGSLTKWGAATLTLSGASTYSEGTTVNAGTLVLSGGGGPTGRIRGGLAINSGAIVRSSANWGMGYGADTCVSDITISDGTLTFTGTANAGGTSAGTITMTGGAVGGVNFDWYNGLTSTPTLATLASSTTAVISSGFNLRLGDNLTLDVAQGTTPDGVDLLVSGRVTSGPASGINKTGAGTAVLSGVNTYGGPTTVSAGKLVVSSAATGTGAITVNDNATLGVLTAGTSQLNPTTLTLGSTSGPTTNEFTGVNSTTLAPINAGTLTVNGTTTINILSGPFYAGNIYPLIAFTSATGTGALVLGTVPAGTAATIVTNGSSIAVSVTASPYKVVTWNGNLGGNWNITTTANWFANGVAGQTYFDNDPVVFDDTATGTTSVTNTVPVAPGGITVNNTNRAYTLGGSPITSSSGLIKNGPNTLTLNGAATLGPMAINAGTVAIGGAGQLNGGNYSLPITDNGTLSYNSSAAQTLSGIISGTGSLTQNAGTLTLGANEGYTGGTTVNGGILNLSGGSPTIRNNLTINTGAQVVGGTWALGYDGLPTWITNMVINGGTLTLNGPDDAGTSAQNITLTGGTIAGTGCALYTPNPSVTFTVATLASSTASLWSAPCMIRIGSSGTLNFDVAKGTVPSGVDLLASGLFRNGSGGTVVKSGNGVMQMTAANSYSYPTVISNGTLIVSSAQSGTGNITVNDGATLGVTASGASQLKPATLTLGSSGSITNQFSGVISTTTAPLKPTTLIVNGATTVNIVSGSFVAGNTYPLIAFTTITGAGSFALGTLPAGVSASLVSTATDIVLQVTAAPLTVWNGNLSGIWDIANTANWKVSSVPSTYLDGATVMFDDTASGTTSVTNAVTVSPGGILVNNTNLAYTIGGSPIAGGAGLSKSGPNTLTLTSPNAFNGGAVISGGRVSFDTSGLGSGAVTFAGNATLQWIGANSQDKSSGMSISSGVTATLDTTGNNVTFASALSGSGGRLAKTGSGTLTLNALNTYSGGTIVNAGTLVLGSGGQVGIINGALTINDNATVNTPSNWGLGYANGTCVNSIAINGGTLSFTGTPNGGGTSASTITMNAGTISGVNADWYNGITSTPTVNTMASSATATISSGFRLRLNNNSLTFNVAQGTTPSGVDLLVSGNIISAYADGITKTGAGLMALAGAHTYTGPTIVSGGTLLVDAAGIVAAGSSVTIQTNATLAGTGEIDGATTIQAGGRLAPGGLTGIGTLYSYGTLLLSAGSSSHFRISKAGGLLSADSVQLGAGGVTYGGTLTVTNITSDGTPLANGDTFQLFVGGPYSGGFARVFLPALPAGLVWDISGLATGGSIQVTSGSVVAPTPTFNPPEGGYVGAQSVTLGSTAPGAIIRYTTNGTTPTSSSAVYSSPIIVPVNTTMTLKAYATAPGYLDSGVASATYFTEPEAIWITQYGGSWATGTNWTNNIIPNASGITANFGTLTLATDTTVTLDGAQTIGQLIFGDVGNAYNWVLDTGSGGSLTLAGTTPTVTVNNQTATIGALLEGISGMTKTGNGTLILSANPAYSGGTTVSGGTLTMINNAIPPGPLVVSSGAVLNSSTGLNPLPMSSWTVAGTINLVDGAGTTFPHLGTFTLNGGTLGGGGSLILSGGASQGGMQNYLITANGIGNSISCQAIGGYFGGDVNMTLSLDTPLAGDTLVVSTVIQDGAGGIIPIGVTKAGLGTVTLSGTNTSSGPTTVSKGTLLVSGSLAAGSAVTVATGGTLGGTGTFNGPVTIQTGGTLTTDPAGISTLTIRNTLNLAGNVNLRINSGSLTSDRLQGITSVTYGGTLTVANLAGTLAAGNTFQLFNATTYGGNFAAMNLPTLGGGLAWSWTPANGTLAVVAVLTPPVLSGYGPLTGSTFPLTFSGPSGQSYKVLSSTNVALPLTDWMVRTTGTFGGSPVTYQDTGATNAHGFYRIVSP